MYIFVDYCTLLHHTFSNCSLIKLHLKFATELRPNLHRLFVLYSSYYLEGFKNNRIVVSRAICLGTTSNHRFGDIFLCLKYYFKFST